MVVKQFSPVCLGIDERFSASIGFIILIRSLELKAKNLVYWLPVRCSEGIDVAVFYKLGPLPGKLGELYARAQLSLYQLEMEYFYAYPTHQLKCLCVLTPFQRYKNILIFDFLCLIFYKNS